LITQARFDARHVKRAVDTRNGDDHDRSVEHDHEPRQCDDERGDAELAIRKRRRGGPRRLFALP